MSDDHKRGRRPPAAVHEVHLQIVEDMIVASTPWPIILETCMDRFDVEEVTVRKWAQEAHRRIAAAGEERRPYARAIYQAKLEAAQYRFASDGLTYVNLLKLEAKLHGLDQPIKVDVTGRVSVAAMTPEARKAEIEDLMRRRDLAMAATAVKH